jgi:hypothetical protein
MSIRRRLTALERLRQVDDLTVNVSWSLYETLPDGKRVFVEPSEDELYLMDKAKQLVNRHARHISLTWGDTYNDAAYQHAPPQPMPTKQPLTLTGDFNGADAYDDGQGNTYHAADFADLSRRYDLTVRHYTRQRPSAVEGIQYVALRRE